jgi:hypothetical protein
MAQECASDVFLLVLLFCRGLRCPYDSGQKQAACQQGRGREKSAERISATKCKSLRGRDLVAIDSERAGSRERPGWPLRVKFAIRIGRSNSTLNDGRSALERASLRGASLRLERGEPSPADLVPRLRLQSYPHLFPCPSACISIDSIHILFEA